MAPGPSVRPVTELVIAADDRTGALEVAGECAARTRTAVTVVPFDVAMPSGAQRVVVDLGSRHRPPEEASRRAREVVGTRPSHRAAHKLDSALRGNWAIEVVARAAPRTVVVPALPAVGRHCIDGVVGQVDDGTWRPIDEVMADDPRGAPASSRPADMLRQAGAEVVVELGAAAALVDWLDTPRPGIAVCDARSAADLGALGEIVARSDALLAGTAAAIAAWSAPGADASYVEAGASSVVVVCGTLDAGAREQLAVARAAGLAGLTVVASPSDVARPVPDLVAEAMGRALAAEAREVVAAHHPDVLVILGGDTTAAVLGDAAITVTGLVAPGTPIGRRLDGTGPAVVTRSGSFGDANALLDLVRAIMGR